jgi:flagellar basal body-associated protein FliL
VIIFLYKKRILQIRILVFSVVLLLGLFGLFFYFTYAGFTGAKVAFKVPVVFPVVAVILDYLAIRAIGKDEALIRSLNRIR